MNTFLSDETKMGRQSLVPMGMRSGKRRFRKRVHDRQQCLIDSTRTPFDSCGADYVWPFAMFDGDST